MLKNKGQSTLEYVVLIIVVMGALIATSDYVKRAIQGRWKTSVDDLGDQYDPAYANSTITHATNGTSITSITTINATGGFWTKRLDSSNMEESKAGFTAIGAY